MSSNVAVIETQQLHKAYGHITAVDDLTLTVLKGEVFGFLGPNGAGKTTSIKMLLGLVHPTRGTARLLGEKPDDPAIMSRVGFLPEHFRFQHWLTAASLLDAHGRLYGMPARARRQRIPHLLEKVGLADRANTRLSQFSKGMTQRLGLAQALLNHPEVVFLDEPTSGLDPLGRRLVRDIIGELQGSGATVFLNSHFLSEVELSCDRVAIISHGRVIRQGSLIELTGEMQQTILRVGRVEPSLIADLQPWGDVITHSDHEITLQLRDENEIPALVAWMVNQGVQLYALTPRRMSLEEYFVQILEEEGRP